MDKREKAKAYFENIINTANGIIKVLTDDNLTDFAKRFQASMVAEIGYRNAVVISSQIDIKGKGEGIIISTKDNQEKILRRIDAYIK